MALSVTVASILIVLALVFLIISAVGRLPLWPAVLCLVLERLVALGIGLRAG
jgi:hypothetical protein